MAQTRSPLGRRVVRQTPANVEMDMTGNTYAVGKIRLQLTQNDIVYRRSLRAEPDTPVSKRFDKLNEARSDMQKWMRLVGVDPDQELIIMDEWYSARERCWWLVAMWRSPNKYDVKRIGEIDGSNDTTGEAVHGEQTGVPGDGEREAGRSSGEDTRDDPGGDLPAIDDAVEAGNMDGADAFWKALSVDPFSGRGAG